MDEWVKIPTEWIRDKEDPGLRRFSWRGPDRSSFIAALMLYICIAHHAVRKPTDDLPRPGLAKLSYTKLTELTDLSRAKIASGTRILHDYSLVQRLKSGKTNVYRVVNYEIRSGWAKLPCKSLYDEKEQAIVPFKEFKLRHKNELNALKLYLLLVSFRDNQSNHANPSYDKIQPYTGISRNEIRSAISLLINLGMIHVDRIRDPDEEQGKVRNVYRILGIENHRHTGNISYDQLRAAT